MIQLLLIIYALTLLAMGLGWVYFRHFSLKRPPIGVFNLWDVAVMMAGILLVPYLYLLLPTWLVASLLGLSALSVSYFCLEPLLPGHWPIWLVILGLGLGDLAALNVYGANSVQFLVVNNVVQIIVVVGITNLWTQSGMKARDAAILGGALIIYDYIFTARLPLMDELFGQLDGLPFSPLVAWSAGDDRWAAIGLGDLLLATVFPLVMRKAYGQAAGLIALGLAMIALLGVVLVTWSGWWIATFPVMIILGPLMAGQYGYWRWQQGSERRMVEYWQQESEIYHHNNILRRVCDVY